MPLTTHEEVIRFTTKDLGESVKTLVRVSHVHIFGLALIFILTGIIFSFSSMHRYLKLVIIIVPFAAMWIDIGSWWFTKFKPFFANMIIIGGALMGLSLSIQILYSLYDIWLNKRDLS